MKHITIANRKNKTFEVKGNKSLLQELRSQGVDLPYGCQYGGCITCAAKLIDDEVDQRTQVALNNRQINDGYIILCVALIVPLILIISFSVIYFFSVQPF